MFLALVVGGINASAQSAADLVTSGRRLLATNDLACARDYFVAAAALAPDDTCANALAGITRVLRLADQPAGKAILERVGLAVTNRGLCGWMTCPMETTTTAGATTAGNLTDPVEAKALEEISAGATSLARIRDTNFTLALASNETATVGVTIDYGDVLLLRSGFELGRYACYALHGLAAQARAVALRSFFGGESPASLPRDEEIQTLLSVPGTGNRRAAQEALTNAVALYLGASDFIRLRPTNCVRLFNYNPQMASAEARFKEKLKDLSRATGVASARPSGAETFTGK